MALTNYEFAQLTARVAQRGANWTRDTMSMGQAYLDRETNQQAAAVFCKDVKEILDQIHPLARSD